ncbi:MAG TPA: hypothetical protein VG892_05155, partial [Terriglobales bacterium]|nr:hypothetical protein [Terriglobales bacterium]
MSKELFVSSTPHEIRVALVEDGQLSEVYYERENEYTLAGSIYKGRVTRVLPGMQSAFVDLGLERDAFLYVSDFFEMEEDDEDFEPVAVNRQQGGQRQDRPQQSRPEQSRRAEQGAGGGGSSEVHPGAEAAGGAPYVFEGGEDFEGEGAEGSGVEAKSEEVSGGEAAGGARAESGAEGERGSRPWGGRRRRRGRRGRGFPDAKFSRPSEGREADGPGDDQRSEGAQEQPGGNEETQPNVLAAFPEAGSEWGSEPVSEASLEPDLEVRQAPISDRGQRERGRRDQSTRGHVERENVERENVERGPSERGP